MSLSALLALAQLGELSGAAGSEASAPLHGEGEH